MNMNFDKVVFIDDIDAKDLINPKDLHLDDNVMVVGCAGASIPESLLKLGFHHHVIHCGSEVVSKVAHIIILCERVIDNIDAEAIAEFMRSVKKAKTFKYDIPDSDYVFKDFANAQQYLHLSRAVHYVQQHCRGRNCWVQISMKRALNQIRLIQKKDCVKEI